MSVMDDEDDSSTTSTTDINYKTASSHQQPHQSHHRIELIECFISQIEEAIKEKTFVSLTLRGPSNKKKRKKKQNDFDNNNYEDELLRGCIRQVQGRLVQLKKKKQSNLVLQMTFKYYLATDIAKNWDLDEIRHGLLSLLLDPQQNHNDSSAAYNMIPKSEWGSHQQQQCQEDNDPTISLKYGIQSATLITTQKRYELEQLRNNKPKFKQTQFAIIKSETDNNKNNAMTAQPQQHDRIKQVPLQTQQSQQDQQSQQQHYSSFMVALGLTDQTGKPKSKMTSKLRQCQKFVEIVGNLITRCCSGKDHNDNEKKNISILDMGCGKGYLTFSLHAYLTEKFSNKQINSIGIDIRPKLVQEINTISQSLGPNFKDKLIFQTGSIESILAKTQQQQQPDDDHEHDSSTSSPNNSGINHNKKSSSSSDTLNILIALHACDTATDDALWYGIDQKMDILVVAPCCHKQLRPQLDAHMKKHQKQHPLIDLLRHNIYRERYAEMITDSMRAILIEMAGYYTPTVFEFISGEHTAKNTMIVAIRRKNGKQSSHNIQQLQQRLQDMANLHGIRYQKLAQWMNIDLVQPVKATGIKQIEDDNNYIDEDEIMNNVANGIQQTTLNNSKLMSGNMPPLP